MPQVFDKIGRDKVREQIFKAGFTLIKQHGLKKTSVSEIAKCSGIATGTFYNFFSSKEEFVYQLILYKRAVVKDAFAALTSEGKVRKEQFKEYLHKVYLEDNDVFQYLNDSEIDLLNARWPAEYWKNHKNDEQSSRWMISNLEGVNPNCDWKVFANFNKSIALIRHGQERLYQERYEETLNIYIDAIIRYLFNE